MILITGGAGYIGSHVNKELSKKGYETLIYDSLVYGHRELVKWGRLVVADLGDTERLNLVFKEYPIEAVMHFAAYTYVGESMEDPQKYYLNNVKNTLNLLQAMLDNGVEYIVFSSSCATYGLPKHTPIIEEHPQKPINPYGRSKLMVEEILRDYSKAYGLKYVSLRYFNAAGADPECETGEWHEPETHLIPRVLDVALGNREAVEIYGTDYPTPDGTCIRDFIHVSDLAVAHVLALEYLKGGGVSEVFNLGNERGFSVKEVINTAELITGKKLKTVEKERRPGDPPVLVSSSEKIKKVLGWNPKYHELSYIIQTAWEWHRKLKEVWGY